MGPGQVQDKEGSSLLAAAASFDQIKHPSSLVAVIAANLLRLACCCVFSPPNLDHTILLFQLIRCRLYYTTIMLYQTHIYTSSVLLIFTLIGHQFRPSHAYDEAYTNVVSGAHMQAHGCLRKLWIDSYNFAVVFDKNRVYGVELANKTVTPINSIVQIRALQQGQVAIRGVNSGLYLCVGKRNKWTTQAKLDESKCLFHEWIDQFGKFYFYRTYNSNESEAYPRTVIKRKYLTFNQKGVAVRKGKPKAGSAFELVNVPSDENDTECQPQSSVSSRQSSEATAPTNSLESRLLKGKSNGRQRRSLTSSG